MDSEDDIQRYASGGNGAPNGDCSVSYEGLNKIRRDINCRINWLSCDEANIEEMMANLEAGRPIWYDLYDNEQDWLEFGYPWVKKYLDKISS